MGLIKKDTIENLIKSGKINKLNKLLNSDNCNNLDDQGKPPLYYAIKYEKSQIAKLLLELGSIPEMGSSSPEESVMVDVIKTFNQNLLNIFLEHELSLPETINKLPLLHYVVSHKYFYPELLPILLAHDIDINQIDTVNTEKTALAYLLSLPDFSLRAFNALLEEGADVNYATSEVNRPLTILVDNREIPATSKLGKFSFSYLLQELSRYNLEMNYTIRTFTGSQTTLAQKTLQSGKIEEFLLLLEYGLWVDTKVFPSLENYLDVNKFSMDQRKRMVNVNRAKELNLPLSSQFYGNKAEEVLEENLKDNRDPSDIFIDIARTTKMPLTRKIPILEQLLEKGANINHLKSYAGFELNVLTALTCWNEDIYDLTDLLQWLLDHGALIENEGHSAYLWAIWYNKRDLVRFYGDRNADICYTDVDGATIFSRLFSYSPSHNQYRTSDDHSNMLHLIKEIFDERQLPFPLEEEFKSGTEPGILNGSSTLGKEIVLFKKTTRFNLVKELLACGWNINKKFEAYRPEGSLILQLLCSDVDEYIVTYLLDNYPDIDIANPGSGDPLFYALKKHYSPETIKRFIDKAPDINKEIVRYFDSSDEIVQSNGSYIELVLDIAINKDTSIEESEEWAYQICSDLIEAGHDVNHVTRLTLNESMQGKTYRTLLSLLEQCHNFKETDYKKVFNLLLDKGADPYLKLDRFEENFIHFITQRSQRTQSEVIDILEELDRRHLFDIETKTNNGATPLVYAASKCQTELINYLISKGANPNAIGGFDQSYPIHRAITNWDWVSKKDRLETVKALLDGGADLEAIDNDGYSPLMAAAGFGCLEVVQEILKRGANPNLCNSEGKSALNFAITDPYCYDEKSNDDTHTMKEEFKLHIIEALHANGADLNNSYSMGTPLIDTIGYDYRYLYHGLLKLGASIHATDGSNRTPLMIASKWGALHLIKDLLSHENIQESLLNVDQRGDNILHYLVNRVYQETGLMVPPLNKTIISFIKKYMDEYNVPYSKNNYGQTPLHYLVQRAMTPPVKELLQRGININEVDNYNNTALMYAVNYDEELVEEANVVSCIKFLIEEGIDVNTANEKNQTALQIAKEREKTDIIDILINAGAEERGKIGF
ncbi:ankyrin repeat domain-containing protein [Spirochaeta cellobiosiphila]|uniref:ankyrin repeat domain-containing protein n=1 Tax=Spirochaeta cellobiosiphila TaxID=504483 RepID=UPI00041666AB|nr:ankyrin repeat domain-containing protein [Spirochaeta cellobiosiphila]